MRHQLDALLEDDTSASRNLAGGLKDKLGEVLKI